MSIHQGFSPVHTGLVWRDADHVCTFSDNERHYGHAIQLNRWHAYDATKLNDAGNGFKYLGEFDTAALAKQAIESSVSAAAAPEIKRRSVPDIESSKETCRRLREEG